ncbi:MAG: hypothetical protein KDD29_10150 [Flavobacteriales bacterium]|nr:hypothetical protein [Flavobacteriales bacterium]MCB9335467.1 hypothetical protein [Flavobacteriales bacterium]
MSFSDKNTIRTKELLQSKKLDCDTLRTYEGFENISNKEAEFIIEQLERLALILYKQIINE